MKHGKKIVRVTVKKQVKKGELLTMGDVSPAPSRWSRWYEIITPFLGVKWGAEVTLIYFGWLTESDGLRIAAGISAMFLFLEWCQMAWCDFKRRVK